MNTLIGTHKGHVALVTGAAQGIGQALAVALAQRGAEVIVTDLTFPHETAKMIGSAAHAFQLDVTQEEEWRSLSVKSRDVGETDIVVNNAGYFPNRLIDDLDLPTWRKTMATNLDAHFLSAKYFLPGMRKKMGPLRRNIFEYGRPGDTGNEPLHHLKNGNHRLYARFGQRRCR